MMRAIARHLLSVCFYSSPSGCSLNVLRATGRLAAVVVALSNDAKAAVGSSKQ